jgi:hypothetical protein
MKKYSLKLFFFFIVANINAQVTFSLPVKTITGTTARELIVADFNNDGKQDFIICADNTLKLYLGNGTYTPTTPITLPTSAIYLASSALAIGDVNNDGNLDIIIHDRNFGVLDTLIGNGQAGFVLLTQSTLTSEFHSPSGIKCLDFNNDGNSDILISTQGSYFRISFGNGDGTFQNSINLVNPLLNSGTGANFMVEDCNDDGNIDVVTVNGIAYGNGLGSFSNSLSINTSTFSNDVVRDDFNNDGFKDLAISSIGVTGNLTLYLSNYSGDLVSSTSINYDVNTIPEGIAKGDFNNDGILDIATCNYTNDYNGTINYSVSVYIGSGSGNFNNPIQLPLDAYPINIAISDLNSDGKLDIVVATTTFQSAIPTVGKLVRFFNTSDLSYSQFSQNENKFSIYPNPSSGIVQFTGDESLVKQIKIYDNLGRLIKQINERISKNINLNDLIDGSYFVKIETASGTFNQKLIIKK